jgi:hypothetical protein
LGNVTKTVFEKTQKDKEYGGLLHGTHQATTSNRLIKKKISVLLISGNAFNKFFCILFHLKRTPVMLGLATHSKVNGKKM